MVKESILESLMSLKTTGFRARAVVPDNHSCTISAYSSIDQFPWRYKQLGKECY